ncbi:MAG: hypothetical protein ACR5KW_01710 [Wolbachia sp.]
MATVNKLFIDDIYLDNIILDTNSLKGRVVAEVIKKNLKIRVSILH